MFSSYVTLIPLQCVPFIYQNMQSPVMDMISFNTDESASIILVVFMPSYLPS